MGAHRRVARGELVTLQAGRCPLHRLAPRLLDRSLARGVHGGQAVEEAAERRRQGLLGEVLVGELGVAAVGRNLDAVEDRAHRRSLLVDGVGVPEPAEVAAVLLALEDRLAFRILFQSPPERVCDTPARTARDTPEVL